VLRNSKDSGFTADTPDEQVIAAIVQDPNLLQRPIVEVGDQAVVARPIEKALELLDIR
jgi:arsenate reductase